MTLSSPDPRMPDTPAEDGAGRLGAALFTIADEARPLTTTPAGLWSRGRRRHRRRMVAHLAAAVLVLAAAVTVPAILARGLPWTAPAPAPAQPRPSVPATVAPPWLWQSTVQDSPLGPATLVVTGDGFFRSDDSLDGYEDDGMVVGPYGFNRMVKYNGTRAGLLLSPDGRYLAGDGSMQGATRQPVPAGDPPPFVGATALLDLTTGTVRTFPVGEPMVWSPDGRLLTLAGGTSSTDGLRLLDPRTGDAPRVFRPPYAPPDQHGMAFSPDGKRIAVVSGATVYQVDVAAQRGRPLFNRSDNQVLAGSGAWTPHGRLALWEIARCLDVCGSGLGAVQASDYRVTYVDADTGTTASGPRLDMVSAHSLRLLGWTPDGAAIVHLFHEGFPPEHQQTSQILALHPGGGRSTLVTLPRGAREVNLARDVIQQGRFGGSTPSWAARVADVIDSRRSDLLWTFGVGAALFLAARMIVDLRRRRPPRRPRRFEDEHEASSW